MTVDNLLVVLAAAFATATLIEFFIGNDESGVVLFILTVILYLFPKLFSSLSNTKIPGLTWTNVTVAVSLLAVLVGLSGQISYKIKERNGEFVSESKYWLCSASIVLGISFLGSVVLLPYIQDWILSVND